MLDANVNVACVDWLQQGRLSTKSYLEQFVSTARPPIKDTPNRRSYCRDDLTVFIDDDLSEIIDERDYAENATVPHQHQSQHHHLHQQPVSRPAPQ